MVPENLYFREELPCCASATHPMQVFLLTKEPETHCTHTLLTSVLTFVRSNGMPCLKFGMRCVQLKDHTSQPPLSWLCLCDHVLVNEK